MVVRPRIGIHCPGTGSGGPWRYVHSLLKNIDTAEFEPIVICDIPGDYAPRPEISVARLSMTAPLSAAKSAAESEHNVAPRRGLSSRLKSLVGRQARVVLGFHRTAKTLAATIRPLHLDLFHTQNTGCEEAPCAARLAGVPHIVGTFHTDWTFDLHGERAGAGYRLLESISNRSMHRAIAVSHATGRNWLRRTALPVGRMVTIHNGIDAAMFARSMGRRVARLPLKIPEEAFVVLGLGRLDEAKGFADLIEAAAIARPAIPNLRVLIAGDGPLRSTLEFQAFQRGVADCVQFAGFVSDVQPVLDAADIFALPSVCEACPYAVLEAMAAGLSVIGSQVGGVPELIEHGRTGFVLPPRSPTAWAAALIRMHDDKRLCESMGAAGHARVIEHFSEAKMTTQTFGVYRELLSGIDNQ
jgi:glycosyltransferase involved in cell wall biosynthesis